MSINITEAGKTIFTLRWQPNKDLLAIVISWVLVVAALYSATFLVGSTVAGGMAYFGLYAVLGATVFGMGIPLYWTVVVRKRPVSDLGLARDHVKDIKVPLLSNLRTDIVLLLILGMAMCTQGIGRVAATGQWTHPLAILGYILGALIFLVALSGFFGWKLFFIQTGQQALLTMAVLMTAKVVGTAIHYLLNRSSGV